VTGDAHVVSIADGEGDTTGRVTIDGNGATFEIVWTSTALRDVLGFEADGNLSGALTYTSTDHAKMVWQPGVPVRSEFGTSDLGKPISNLRQSMSPAGAVKSLGGIVRREQRLAWGGVPHKRMRVAGEGAGQANMSLEQFWLDAVQGEFAGATIGGKIRMVWDADVNGTYYEFYPIGDFAKMFAPRMTTEDLTAWWSIEIDTSKAP
jgi:hypothetical protein